MFTLRQHVTFTSVTRVTVSKLEDEGREDGDEGKEDGVLFQIHVENSHVEGDGDSSSDERVKEERNLFLGGDFVGGDMSV